MSSEKQLLKCFRAQEQTEPLSTGHQATTQLEPPVESCCTDQISRSSGPSNNPQREGSGSSLGVSVARGRSKQGAQKPQATPTTVSVTLACPWL